MSETTTPLSPSVESNSNSPVLRQTQLAKLSKLPLLDVMGIRWWTYNLGGNTLTNLLQGGRSKEKAEEFREFFRRQITLAL